jgi:uncharacterized protein YjbI with pentapeptide repeats
VEPLDSYAEALNLARLGWTEPRGRDEGSWWNAAPINLAQAQLAGVVFTETPPGWLTYDEAFAAFRLDACRAEGLTPSLCGPVRHDYWGHDRTTAEAAAQLARLRSIWCARQYPDETEDAPNRCETFFAHLESRVESDWRTHRNNERAALRAPVLAGVDLRDADLSGARMEAVDLRDARLDGALLGGARLEGAEMRRARLEGADLTSARLEHAFLNWAQMRQATLRWAHLDGAYLRWAKLERANLVGARLVQAKLQSTELRLADLTEANLRQAELSSAGLEMAKLQGANLADANLQYARLHYTNLRSARLEGAYLFRTQVTALTISQAPFSKVPGCDRLTSPTARSGRVRSTKASPMPP